VKVRIFKGSLLTPLAFGIQTVRRYGRPGVVLLAVLFVIMWLVLTSIFGLVDKTAQVGFRFPDVIAMAIVHVVFVLWAFCVAVCMVPKFIASARRERQRKFSRPRLSRT